MPDEDKASHNGYRRVIILYNVNDVVNKHRNNPKDIITVPPKRNFHCFTLACEQAPGSDGFRAR